MNKIYMKVIIESGLFKTYDRKYWFKRWEPWGGICNTEEAFIEYLKYMNITPNEFCKNYVI